MEFIIGKISHLQSKINEIHLLNAFRSIRFTGLQAKPKPYQLFYLQFFSLPLWIQNRSEIQRSQLKMISK